MFYLFGSVPSAFFTFYLELKKFLFFRDPESDDWQKGSSGSVFDEDLESDNGVPSSHKTGLKWGKETASSTNTSILCSAVVKRRNQTRKRGERMRREPDSTEEIGP